MQLYAEFKILSQLNVRRSIMSDSRAMSFNKHTLWQAAALNNEGIFLLQKLD